MISYDELRTLREKSHAELAARHQNSDEVGIRKDGTFYLKGDYFEKQFRIALRNCGIIDPYRIEDYIATDGYKALADLLEKNISGKPIVDEMKKSNLRGRGGAGFPTGAKWEEALIHDDIHKYIVCNADEGDPGAFMDRSILELDPHSVIEGMAIAALGVGGDKGYIYVRAEYPTAVKSLRNAIAQAEEMGLLGKNILGTDFSFELEIRLGAGAFVCGEATALIESIEGHRGMPRNKVYRTAHKGLFQMPTVINNVETLANVATIMRNGADWFRMIGTEKSPGTKVFSVVGKVLKAGLVEVPMGTSLRSIIYDISGGLKEGKQLKAVQTGGPSGGCIPADYIDSTTVDFESLAKIGSIMGSGGMVVIDEDDCMVDIARFFMDFTVEESCGKCTPCRVGNKRVLEMLERITHGQAEKKDLVYLKELCEVIRDTSLCGLGQTATNPVLSTMKYFEDEYMAHVTDKRCHASVCRSLLIYLIGDRCIGCGLCKVNCPVQCIDGERRQKHHINIENCIKCGTCMEKCPANAITLQ
ncbi:MAG: NADH-ubiquinone oxidoreductase-F iron-sulfur binding region domain-containing protein [Peptostreptococcaceae bacterium]|nr:NADH-ubiquinone oxidoreductase-F iron-sulfur binding region domain-containing protein [Peptostreptococcaceae bacterium]